MVTMKKIWHILAFDSTHAAMAAQKLLAHLDPFVIPTPKEITASCGISLRMGAAAAAQAKEVLADHANIAQRSAWYVLANGKRVEGAALEALLAEEAGAAAAPREEAAGEAPAAATYGGWFPVTGDPAPGATLTMLPATRYYSPAGTGANVPASEDSSEDVQVEHVLDVYVNDVLTMRVVCTPEGLFDLVVGRLFTEGIISAPDQVARIDLVEESTRANVQLADRQADLTRVKQQVLASTGSGNRVFNAYFEDPAPLEPVVPMDWDPEWIFSLARRFATDSPMHRKTSGTHSCYLAVRDEVLYCCEDLGRHNAFDKVLGCALRDGVDLTSAIVFSSGRLPVDMVQKGIRSRIPVLVSKAVPTHMTIQLARKYGLTLICSARPDSMKVFNDQLCSPQERN